MIPLQSVISSKYTATPKSLLGWIGFLLFLMFVLPNQSAQADLLIEAFRITDALGVDTTQFTPGETLQIHTSVWNKGRTVSSETTLRYYLSTDADITPEDTEVANDRVNQLSGRGAYSPRRRATKSKTLTAPDTPGVHYYSVCVDAIEGEMDIRNNCSQAIAITVTAPPPAPVEFQEPAPREIEGPDLIISAARVDAATIKLGTGVRLHITLTNQGTRAAPATTIRYYRSSDATISPEDTELRAVSIGQIGAGRSVTTWAFLPAATALGVYYYGACIDGVAAEDDTLNNCSFGRKVKVEAQGSEQKLLIPVGTIPSQHLRVGGSSVVLDVSGNFVGQVENWQAYFSGAGVLGIRTSGSELTLAPISEGWWLVTVEARRGTLLARQTFSVSVIDADTLEADGTVLPDVSPEVSIPDENLRAVVRDALELQEDDTLTRQKMQQLTRIRAPMLEIKSLAGLEHAIRLTELDMPQNQIYDISPLTNLTTLTRVVLDGNYISDITPLRWLTRLTKLSLSHNRIGDISPLTHLIGLTELRLQGNQIRNIHPLVGLTRLTKLSLSGNQIRDITPLQKLTETLTTLELSGNPVVNFAPLRGLKEKNPGVTIDIDITADSNNAQGAPSIPVIPAETALLSNYPNPFNPETWIPYQLGAAADVSITIYNVRGVVVRRLAIGHQPAGLYHSCSAPRIGTAETNSVNPSQTDSIFIPSPQVNSTQPGKC